MTNVVPFRPAAPDKPHPFEIVEVIADRLIYPPEIIVAVAGPWSDPPRSYPGGRDPWQRVATFPAIDPEAAARRAQELSAELGIPIVDLAGIMPAPDDGPEAA